MYPYEKQINFATKSKLFKDIEQIQEEDTDAEHDGDETPKDKLNLNLINKIKMIGGNAKRKVFA